MRSLALTVALAVAALMNVRAAQQAALPSRLVGVWHLSAVDHRYGNEERLYTLELEITPTKFRTYYRVDLEDPSVCEGPWELDAKGLLWFDTTDAPSDECDAVNESEVFDGPFYPTATARSLQLRETGVVPPSDEPSTVLRFERGRVQRLPVRVARPCEYSIKTDPVDGDGTLPPLARRSGPSFFLFDWHFENGWITGPSSTVMQTEVVRRRWLQRAVDALEGRAEPVLLRFSSPTRHGDDVEQFLDVRRGRADLTIWQAPGFYGDGELTRCSISHMLAVEALADNRLVPMRPDVTTARARLLLRLDPEDSEQVSPLFP